MITISKNHPPTPPVITGSTNGRIKKEYKYTFRSTDEENDQIYYYIDWGDGTTSGWVGPYNSGETVTLPHQWNKKGNYVIKALAKDVNELVSSWGMLSVEIPRYKITILDFGKLSNFYSYLKFLFKPLL